jgi:peptidyl-prolyl cis-trans isomerase C
MMRLVVFRLFFITAVVSALLAGGCGEDAALPTTESAPLPEGHRENISALAASVDGAPIRLEEVQELMENAMDVVDGGLSAAEAVDVLIRNELLGAEAERRGYGQSEEVEDVRRLALAKALLTTRVGKGVRPETVDREELRRYFEANKRRFIRGAQRKVVHVLAETKKGAFSSEEARRVAVNAREMALGAESEAEFRERLSPLVSSHDEKMKIETIFPFEAGTEKLVRPFVEAAFKVKEIPGLSRPVETKFGWHVILVLEELPPINRPFGEVEGELAEEVLPLVKKSEAAALIGRLTKEAEVFVFEDALMTGSRKP